MIFRNFHNFLAFLILVKMKTFILCAIIAMAMVCATKANATDMLVEGMFKLCVIVITMVCVDIC